MNDAVHDCGIRLDHLFVINEYSSWTDQNQNSPTRQWCQLLVVVQTSGVEGSIHHVVLENFLKEGHIGELSHHGLGKLLEGGVVGSKDRQWLGWVCC